MPAQDWERSPLLIEHENLDNKTSARLKERVASVPPFPLTGAFG